MLYATVRQRKIYVKNPTSVVQNGVGVDQLILDMDDEWKEMASIVCVFTNGEVSKEVYHTFGKPVLVPWECLAQTGLLSLSCTGYVGEEKVMTTMAPDSFWTVVQNGPVTGDTPMEPTPTLYEQVMAAAGAANTAAAEANAVRTQILEEKVTGVFDGVSPTVEVGSVTTGAAGSEARVVNVGTMQAVKLDFVLPRGAAGPKGTRGTDGVSILDVVQEATSQEDGGRNTIKVTLSDGSERYLYTYNGSKGGKAVRGTDYWTAEDQQKIVDDVLAALPAAEGGSY